MWFIADHAVMGRGGWGQGMQMPRELGWGSSNAGWLAGCPPAHCHWEGAYIRYSEPHLVTPRSSSTEKGWVAIWSEPGPAEKQLPRLLLIATGCTPKGCLSLLRGRGSPLEPQKAAGMAGSCTSWGGAPLELCPWAPTPQNHPCRLLDLVCCAHIRPMPIHLFFFGTSGSTYVSSLTMESCLTEGHDIKASSLHMRGTQPES